MVVGGHWAEAEPSQPKDLKMVTGRSAAGIYLNAQHVCARGSGAPVGWWGCDEIYTRGEMAASRQRVLDGLTCYTKSSGEAKRKKPQCRCSHGDKASSFLPPAISAGGVDSARARAPADTERDPSGEFRSEVRPCSHADPLQHGYLPEHDILTRAGSPLVPGPPEMKLDSPGKQRGILGCARTTPVASSTTPLTRVRKTYTTLHPTPLTPQMAISEFPRPSPTPGAAEHL
jgi:hypothetical protein